MAEKLASALERGWHFRRAGHSTVRRVMDNGARGVQVIISGKLTGQRHRTEKFKEGHIKFCGEPKLQWMEEGYTPAKLKAGVIGVKVQIMHPKARLPDEVNILDDKPPEPKTDPSKKLASEKNGAEDSDAKKEKVDAKDEKKGKDVPKKDAPSKKDKKATKKEKAAEKVTPAEPAPKPEAEKPIAKEGTENGTA